MPKSVEELLAQARARLDRVTPDAAADAAGRGALLVDIRPLDKRVAQGGEIPGAVIVGRNEMEWRLDPSSEWRDPAITGYHQDLIILCAEGYQSSLAAVVMQDMGFPTATDLIGGYRGWVEAGLPTQPVPSAH